MLVAKHVEFVAGRKLWYLFTQLEQFIQWSMEYLNKQLRRCFVSCYVRFAHNRIYFNKRYHTYNIGKHKWIISFDNFICQPRKCSKFIILMVRLEPINKIKIKSPCRKIWANKYNLNTNIVQKTNRSIAHDDFNNSICQWTFIRAKCTRLAQAHNMCACSVNTNQPKKWKKNNKNNNNWFGGILSRAPPLKFDWMWKWSWFYTQHTPHVYLWPTGCNM